MRLGTSSLDIYSLKALRTQSNGMFLTWVLKDNSQVTKAPIRWEDLVPAYKSFMGDSSLPSPLEQKGWRLDMPGRATPLNETTKIFHGPSHFRVFGAQWKGRWFYDESRRYM